MIDSAFTEAEEVVEEAEAEDSAEEREDQENGHSATQSDHEDGGRRRRRRRGRRGGRRGRDQNDAHAGAKSDVPGLGEQPSFEISEDLDVEVEVDASELAESVPKTEERRSESGQHHRRPRKRGRDDHRGQRSNHNRNRPDRPETAQEPPAAEAETAFDQPREVDRDAEAPLPMIQAHAPAAAAEPLPESPEDSEPRRWQPPTATVSESPAQPKSGWWRRKSG
jgi:ribonuclease E